MFYIIRYSRFYTGDLSYSKGVEMPFYFTPHTTAWFLALEEFDPIEAEITKVATGFGTNLDGCSICGDDPAEDYELVDIFMEDNAVATIRLCGDCFRMKTIVQGETLVPYISERNFEEDNVRNQKSSIFSHK
jgi:hypothetical protein